MSIRQSVLTLLTLGPSHGYQLVREFERRTDGTWPVTGAQIYSTLERLERDGLVRLLDDSPADQRRFAITDEGRIVVHNWMQEPSLERLGSTRNEMVTKIALALTMPGVDVSAIVGRQRRAVVSQLQELNRARRGSSSRSGENGLGWAITVDALIFAGEAQVRWLDLVDSRVRRLFDEGVARQFGLQDDPPRRGRPRAAATKNAAE
jgi:DNA-binding PadR family transcriptional regulator